MTHIEASVMKEDYFDNPQIDERGDVLCCSCKSFEEREGPDLYVFIIEIEFREGMSEKWTIEKKYSDF